jgi:hypothetical protein
MHDAQTFSHGNILSDAIEKTQNSKLKTQNISPKIGVLKKFFPC